ncbi:MAG: NADH-quinone oxidoreductase subunit A [Egibacteraceae bacterium]
MLLAFVAALTVTAGVFSVMLAVRLLRPHDELGTTWSHGVPLLGGQAPETHAWSRFHARYYPMAIVLIAFEMEMMVMYPWAVVYVELGAKALVEMAVFLTILSLGILYAWREGAYRWQ